MRLVPTLLVGMGLGLVLLQLAAERWLLVLLPRALVGYTIDSRVHAGMPPAQVRRAIWVLLLISAASLLIRGLAGGRGATVRLST